MERIQSESGGYPLRFPAHTSEHNGSGPPQADGRLGCGPHHANPGSNGKGSSSIRADVCVRPFGEPALALRVPGRLQGLEAAFLSRAFGTATSLHRSAPLSESPTPPDRHLDPAGVLGTSSAPVSG